MKLRPRTPSAVHVDPSSRRMFLKSAGGFALSLPMLPSLLTLSSEKAFAASAKPLRYVNIYSSLGGLQHKNWVGTRLPTTAFNLYSGHVARIEPIAGLLTNGGLSPVLDSKYANIWPYVNLMMGVDQPYGQHNRAVAGGAFTPSPFAQDGGVQPTPGVLSVEYPSVDQMIANFNGNGIYTSGLAGRRRQLNITTDNWTNSFARANFADLSLPVSLTDAVGSPSGAFNLLFGSGVPQPQNGSNPILNLINTYWPSGRALMSRLTGADRESLDQFFQLASQAAKDYSVTPPDLSSIVRPAGTDAPWSDVASLNAAADIIALAFKADVTRVVTMKIGENMLDGWHTYTHLAGDNAADPNGGQTEIIGVHKKISDNFTARLANNLLAADPFDPQNPILQNSLVQWSHEHKMAHHNFSTPMLMIGAAGGRLNTGLFADLRNGTTARDNDNHQDPLINGDIINRAYATHLFAMNVPRALYEMTRGGLTTDTIPLTQGYGYVYKNDVSPSHWSYIQRYNLSRIGEPWEFLMKAGMPWGT